MSKKTNGKSRSKQNLALMTPDHPQWQAFIKQLCGPTALGETGCLNDLRYSRRILKTMKQIDVAVSIAFFKDHGGCCDCEVVMNVAKEPPIFIGEIDEVADALEDALFEQLKQETRRLYRRRKDPYVVEQAVQRALTHVLAWDATFTRFFGRKNIDDEMGDFQAELVDRIHGVIKQANGVGQSSPQQPSQSSAA